MRQTKHILLLIISTIICIAIVVFYNYFNDILYSIDEFISSVNHKEVQVPSTSQYHRMYEYETLKETDNFIPNTYEDIQNIYYTVLNNGWESFTFYCPKSYENCKEDVRSIGNDFEYISLLNNYVSPFNSYNKYNTMIIGSDEIYLQVDKLYTNEEIDFLNKKIKSIISELNIDKNSIKLNDLRSIHNYIVRNSTYDNDFDINDELSISNKANGMFETGKYICSGYTDMLALLLDELNIPNFKIMSENHVWNVVYYNGKWNHIDVTWDDDDKFFDNYNYFLITTKELLQKDSTEHNFKIKLYKELN